jgi:hypothetical protein
MSHKIQNVYTFQEMKDKIDSHEFNAELLLYHAMILLANQQWQPIETAPNDGTGVDLLISFYSDVFRMTDCYWDKSSHSWFCRGSGRYCPYPPSHWMLPPSIKV